jgi:hypothetical protein
MLTFVVSGSQELSVVVVIIVAISIFFPAVSKYYSCTNKKTKKCPFSFKVAF